MYIHGHVLKINFRNVDIYSKEEYKKFPDKKKIMRPYFSGTEPQIVLDGETVQVRRKYETKYNKLFRKFEYNKVLTMALSTNIRKSRPKVLVAVLQELARRQGTFFEYFVCFMAKLFQGAGNIRTIGALKVFRIFPTPM